MCVSQKVGTLIDYNFLLLKGGNLWKNVILEATETHPDILRGRQRYPYQMENALKLAGGSFSTYHLGSIVHKGAVIAYFYGFILPFYELLPTWLFASLGWHGASTEFSKSWDGLYWPSFNCLYERADMLNFSFYLGPFIAGTSLTFNIWLQ